MTKIEITIKDLIIFALLIGIIFFVTIKFIQYEAALNQVKLVNQVNANTQNIQQIATILQGSQVKKPQKEALNEQQ